MPGLLFNFGTPQEARINLDPGVTRIGRTEDNDCTIADASVSTHHCEIILTDDGASVRDLGSTNGTFIDESPVREAPLRSGQTLRLGDVELLFDADTPAELTEVAPPPQPARAATEPPSLPVAAVPAFLAGPLFCANHPKRQAQLYCTQCRKVFCPFCVKTGRTAGVQGKYCLVCGAECGWINATLLQAPKDERTFFQLLPGAFTYPFQGDGWVLMVTGTLFYVFAHFLLNAPKSIFLGVLELVCVVIVIVFAYGYLFSYQLRIISDSAQGSDIMPDWPDFTGFGDVIRPFMQSIFIALACFAPSLAAVIFFHEQDWGRAVAITLFFLGAAYMPMALLAVALFDTIEALNPVFIVPSMLVVFREYLVACAVLLGTLASNVIMNLVLDSISPGGIGEQLLLLAVLGIVSGFIGMYCLVVEMRVLGLLYRSNKTELGWFKR
jgi:pSer/pThr/pTyr-binding forkhead associated (FHA) protein